MKHTKNEPCLAEMKVNAEVCVKADVREGHVSTWCPAQCTVFPIAVPDTLETRRRKHDKSKSDTALNSQNCSQQNR